MPAERMKRGHKAVKVSESKSLGSCPRCGADLEWDSGTNFPACESCGFNPGESSEDMELYEAANGPQDGDYLVTPSGRLGSKVAVSIKDGSFLGDFDDDEEADRFIKERMNQEKFWPSVWSISDHGNVEPRSLE